MYVNINEIKDKIKSPELTAQTCKAHILAVVETKQIPPRIEGFGNWNHKERKNKGGGGVAIAARGDINQNIIKVENLEDENQDVVWMEFKKSRKDSIYIGTHYGKQEYECRKEIEG